MFYTNYRAGDAGKSAQTLVDTLLTCDFWLSTKWTDVWQSKIPMLNSLVSVKVFDAFQRLQCACLFTCLLESQLNCPPKTCVQLLFPVIHFFFSLLLLLKSVPRFRGFQILRLMCFSTVLHGPDSVIYSHLCRKIDTADEIWGQQLKAQAARIWKTSRYYWSQTPGV